MAPTRCGASVDPAAGTESSLFAVSLRAPITLRSAAARGNLPPVLHRPRCMMIPVTLPEARDATESSPVSAGPGSSAEARMQSLAKGWQNPQNRDGMALVLSSAVSSAVGLLYWVVAARMFDSETVGVNSTLVSTLGLLGILAQLNLGSAMLRFVPVVGRGARSLVAACYATGIVAAVVIGSVFALGAGWWAPELRAAVGAGALLAYFALSTPFWTVFIMQDYLLTGLKRATVVPFENLAFALLKIGL